MDWLLSVHVGAVVISGAGFFARGVLMLAGSPYLRRRWVRVAPHVVDTLLLASAVGLALRIEQYPLIHHWLTAKVAGLVVYIALGLVALRFGPTRGVRGAAWIGALVAFAYVVSVALTRRPEGFL